MAHHRLVEETRQSEDYLEQVEELLPEMAAKTATKDDLGRVARKGDRNRTVVICVVALICFASIMINVLNAGRIKDNSDATAINTGAIEKLNQARDELRAAGVPEDQLPPPVSLDTTQPVDVDALVQAASATVLAKIRTDPDYQGVIGATGATGPAGRSPGCLLLPSSCQGESGQNGLPGSQGEAGTNGTAGDRGDAGANGENGTNGNDGLNGEKGEKGDKGDKGDTGETGPEGPKGDPGADGADGKCPGGGNMITVTAATGIGGLGETTFRACPA